MRRLIRAKLSTEYLITIPKLGTIRHESHIQRATPFERSRKDYLDDESYRGLQAVLMENPEAGDVIKGTGGLRKLRYGDNARGKGKRGGLRVIYYWQLSEDQFWLFTVYDKDAADDLPTQQRKTLKKFLDDEIKARSAGNEKT